MRSLRPVTGSSKEVGGPPVSTGGGSADREQKYPRASPRVAVTILNWNGLEDTLECLESLFRSSYTNFEAIVVDNGSAQDPSGVIERCFPEVRLILNGRNLGFTGGNNIGMKMALETGADFLWLLNNDTVIERDTLKNLVEASNKSPDIGLASPFIHYHDTPEMVQFCGSYIDWKGKRIVKLKDGDSVPDSGVNVSLWGTALLIKRAVVEKVGYLNEKYFAYHEDEEYSMRVAKAGFRCIVVPESRVFHKNSRSTGSNDAPMQVFLRSRNLFFLWMDALEGRERVSRVRKYLAHIISYGGLLREKELTESVEACMDGVWHAFRGVGGARSPDALTMPSLMKMLFRFLFSWHPFLWTCLLKGDISEIRSTIKRRMKDTGPRI